jgi:micrococcal nuclease
VRFSSLILVIVLATPERDYSLRVASVYDGDTVRGDIDIGFGITLSGRAIRLSNLDAPELTRIRDPRITPQEIVLGVKARDELRQMLATTNIRIYVVPGHETEKYGRILGRVIANGIDVGQALRDRGYDRRDLKLQPTLGE